MFLQNWFCTFIKSSCKVKWSCIHLDYNNNMICPVKIDVDALLSDQWSLITKNLRDFLRNLFNSWKGRKVEQWKNRNVLWPRIKGKTCLHNVSAFTVKSHHVYAAKSNITQVEQIFHIVWTSTAELTGQGKLFFFWRKRKMDLKSDFVL